MKNNFPSISGPEFYLLFFSKFQTKNALNPSHKQCLRESVLRAALKAGFPAIAEPTAQRPVKIKCATLLPYGAYTVTADAIVRHWQEKTPQLQRPGGSCEGEITAGADKPVMVGAPPRFHLCNLHSPPSSFSLSFAASTGSKAGITSEHSSAVFLAVGFNVGLISITLVSRSNIPPQGKLVSDDESSHQKLTSFQFTNVFLDATSTYATTIHI